MKRWIVVEWNQASGRPMVAEYGGVFWTEAEAEDVAADLRGLAATFGRRKRYTVHEIDLGDA